jgi:hypothetical protein
MASSSFCLAGTNLSWLGLRWDNVVKLGRERIECVFQGKPSYVGSIKTAKNWLLVVLEHARACWTDFH